MIIHSPCAKKLTRMWEDQDGKIQHGVERRHYVLRVIKNGNKQAHLI